MLERQSISPFGQIAILLALFVGGALIGTGIVVLIGKFFYGISALDLQTAIMKPQNVGFSRIAQTVSTFFMLALPALILAMIMSKKPLQYSGFTTMISGKQFFIVVLIAFAGLLASDTFATFNEWIPIPKNAAAYFKQLENQYDDAVTSLAGMQTTFDYIISLIVLAFLPAMFEELFFRGALQPVLVKSTGSAFWGILITACFFSAIHLSYYGFLPRAFLGFVLGYIFYYGKNIWLNITVHFLNNAVALTQLYALSKSGKLTADSMNETSPVYIGVFGIVVVIMLLFTFRKESELVISMHSINRENPE